MNGTGVGGAALTLDSANAAPADRKISGSFMIFEAESLVAARKLVESDIYYTAGVVSITLLLGAYLAAFLIRDMVSGTRKNCRFFPLGW